MTQSRLKPEIDLEYLCTVIGNMAGVPIRIYTNEKLSFFHSLVQLPKDPLLLYENDILKIKDAVSYYITSDFDYYGISRHENQCIIIGPARQTAPAEHYLHRLAFQLSVEPDDMQDFLSSMKVIVNMPLESILQILCTVHYVITGEKIGLNDLSIIDSAQNEISKELVSEQSSYSFDDIPDNSENVHNTYEIEQQLLDMVRRGDTVRLQEWISNAPAIRPGRIAADMLTAK